MMSVCHATGVVGGDEFVHTTQKQENKNVTKKEKQ